MCEEADPILCPLEITDVLGSSRKRRQLAVHIVLDFETRLDEALLTRRGDDSMSEILRALLLDRNAELLDAPLILRMDPFDDSFEGDLGRPFLEPEDLIEYGGSLE